MTAAITPRLVSEEEALVLALSPLNPETLQGLAARVAAATGANGTLDHDILRACGYRPEWTPTEPGRSRLEWVSEGRPSIFDAEAHVTESLDAALALVERTVGGVVAFAGPWQWAEHTERAGQKFWCAEIVQCTEDSGLGYVEVNDLEHQGATPALALLSALLAALANRPEKPE